MNIILLSEKDNQISKNNADQGINITNKKEDILEEDEFSSISDEHVEVIDEENSQKIMFVDKDKEEMAEEEVVQSVFKTDKNSIINKISNIDKLKIMKIANSLSANDYRNLINNIKRNDEVLAATEIFELLKNKLSKKQYDELVLILDPYIDIKMIENKINEK